jgi:endonuclease I
MKNGTLTLLSFFITLTIAAQDSTYYQTAFNHSGDALKFELNQIIRNHTEFNYTSSSTDVWDILKATDRDTANPDNVVLIYSGRSVDGEQEYNNGAGWNREHVWAKSRGDFGTSKGAGTDVHHLRPCDISVNSTRNNRNFDTCITCTDVIDGGFDTGSKYDANLWTFEPRDEVKGDVARMIFYMAVRYEGEGTEPDLELTNTLLINTDQSPYHAVYSTLLHWNRLDPVTDWERNRNEIIYNDYQHNRNPFIDFPELAEYLWGDSIDVVWMPEIIDAITEETFKASISVYPNPTSDIVTIAGEFERAIIYNSHGQILETSDQSIIKLSCYPAGVYFIRIMAKNGLTAVFTISKR